MNKVYQTVTTVAFGVAVLGLAIPSEAQVTDTGKAGSLQWIAQSLTDIEKNYPGDGVTNRGAITFVIGNDVWQPGNHFSSGANWLALTCRNTTCALEPAVLVQKKRSWKGQGDAQPTAGQQLHFSLQAGGGDKVLAWFQTNTDSRWLKPTDVPSYFVGGKVKRTDGHGTMESVIDLPNGETETLVPLLVKKEFVCQALKIPSASCQKSGRVLLQLRHATKRQMLLGEFGGCHGTVPSAYTIWVGDLDGDGKPDYIISFSDESGPVHFYLSSAAKPGELVGLAGLYNSPPTNLECDGGEGWIKDW